MAIEHKDITDPNIHEPKGVLTAAADRVYVANGSGSGTWKKYKALQLDSETAVAGSTLIADGSGGVSFGSARSKGRITASASITFNNASYTKLSPTTVAGGNPTAFTEGTNARLTYTGSNAKVFNVQGYLHLAYITPDVSTLLNVQIYKNGVAVSNSLVAFTGVANSEFIIPIDAEVSLNSTDYIEVYASNAASTQFQLKKFVLAAYEV